MGDRRLFIIENPSEVLGGPRFYFTGWGEGGEVVPHWGMSQDRAQRFPSLEAANKFIAEKLPLAVDRCRVVLENR